MKTLSLKNGNVNLPAFFPDGTRGVVKCVDNTDLINCHIEGIVMNAYHLLLKPGMMTIKNYGGLPSFTGWKRPIITDSGGFQVYSLLRENSSFGEVRPNEIIFRLENKKIIFSPEKCIGSQISCGSDVIMALDWCTHPEDSEEIQAKSVETTIRWGKKCMETFKRLNNNDAQIFGIIQGGMSETKRKECADALIEIGFNGFGFGGWPLDKNGNLAADILAYTAELIPENKIKYAMGIGKPENIVACAKMGYNLFDCVIPTREARKNRLYIFNEEYNSLDDIDIDTDFYQYYYVLNDSNRRDKQPISKICDCHTCQNYTRGYLRHLASLGDPLLPRLTTIHNLRFFTMLMDKIRKSL